jgi:hypothetical protein
MLFQRGGILLVGQLSPLTKGDFHQERNIKSREDFVLKIQMFESNITISMRSDESCNYFDRG